MKGYRSVSMKKTGILTLYYNNMNYGGLLQAFALPFVIQKHIGIPAEQIRYSQQNTDTDLCTSKSKKSLSIYQLGINFFSALTSNKRSIRKESFLEFMNDIPHSRNIYSHETIQQCNSNYEIFICGGDQIWNGEMVGEHLDVYTLQFVNQGLKKIAYSPSVAISHMSKQVEDCLGKGLLGIDRISVREKRSLDILKRLSDKKIEVVVDPVLLLNKSEWLEQSRPTKINGKYILCYLLGDSITQRKAVEIISKRLKLRIVTFPHILHNNVRKCDLFFGDIKDYTSGPRQFLDLINNAEFVITDSFHACVFSMIFETPFIVFERNKPSEKGNMNSRIYDFLEEYHLENQLVNVEKAMNLSRIPEVDYSFAHEHWFHRRNDSIEYLTRALFDEREVRR